MNLSQYLPISVGAFVAVMAGALYFSVPILPFAVILLAGETLLGFQLEDHKVPRFLMALFRPPKSGHGTHPQQAH
jgi:hypothetical protein